MYLSSGKLDLKLFHAQVPIPYHWCGLVPCHPQKVHITGTHSTRKGWVQTELWNRFGAMLGWMEIAVRSGPAPSMTRQGAIQVAIEDLGGGVGRKGLLVQLYKCCSESRTFPHCGVCKRLKSYNCGQYANCENHSTIKGYTPNCG